MATRETRLVLPTGYYSDAEKQLAGALSTQLDRWGSADSALRALCLVLINCSVASSANLQERQDSEAAMTVLCDHSETLLTALKETVPGPFEALWILAFALTLVLEETRPAEVEE